MFVWLCGCEQVEPHDVKEGSVDLSTYIPHDTLVQLYGSALQLAPESLAGEAEVMKKDKVMAPPLYHAYAAQTCMTTLWLVCVVLDFHRECVGGLSTLWRGGGAGPGAVGPPATDASLVSLLFHRPGSRGR